MRYRISPEPVGDGIWIVGGADEPIAAGYGGAIANPAIVATDNGAVVVDAEPSLRFGTEFKAVAARLGGGRVARVYLTHFHPDHDYGAAAFDPGDQLPHDRSESNVGWRRVDHFGETGSRLISLTVILGTKVRTALHHLAADANARAGKIAAPQLLGTA